MKKWAYLRERIYERNDCTYQYWESILGKSVLEFLNAKSKNTIFSALADYEFSINKKASTYIFEDIKEYFHNINDSIFVKEEVAKNIVFYEFYKPFLEFACSKLEEKCQNNMIFTSSRTVIKENYFNVLLYRYVDVATRSLVFEMYICKEEGKLQGENPEEEYQYYIKNQLCDVNYIEDLSETYPCLFRMMLEETESLSSNYFEVLESLEKDKEEIADMFCNGKKFRGVKEFTSSFSDSHKNGKMVFFIELDNKTKILYKPRNLMTEIVFQKFAGWLGRKCNIEFRDYKISEKGSYGWEEYIPYKECKTENEVKQFYTRIGVYLFINYILSVFDIHYENIIANGEFPVLIDLETIMKNYPEKVKKTASEMIEIKLGESVLSQGMLPQHIWGNEKKQGIDICGMGGKDGQEMPFRVPGLKNFKRSDMHCEYIYPKVIGKQNLPQIEKKIICSGKYVREVTSGFTMAYEYAWNNKEEILKKAQMFSNISVRYLVRDTQTYSMLLKLSYHPDFLQDGLDRELVLDTLYKTIDLEDKTSVELTEFEIEDLLNNDIPYFTFHTSEKDLFSSKGSAIHNYFQKTSMERLLNRIESLNQEDLKMQTAYLQNALTSIESEKDYVPPVKYSLKQYIKNTNKNVDTSKFLEEAQRIAENIAVKAIISDDYQDIDWYGFSVGNENQDDWKIGALPMNLYGGIAGIGVFFHGINMISQNEKISELLKVIDHRLFEYTDKCYEYLNETLPYQNGVFSGESSILYTYELLYQFTKKSVYLEYAQKHFQLIKSLISADKNFDVLSGNAGALQALLNMYILTKEDKYLSVAIEAGEHLLCNIIKQKAGVCWVADGFTNPLAGYAHGNSGIILALLRLQEQSGNAKFGDAAIKALKFENQLFNHKLGNWADKRVFEGQTAEEAGGDPVAWCHGAGGIVLSRIKSLSYIEDEIKSVVENDIVLGVKKLAEEGFSYNDCLCHGNFGNLLILNEYARICNDSEMKKTCLLLAQKMVEETSGNWKCGQPKLLMHPGLMFGEAGIGYALLKLYQDDLPMILSVDI